MSTQDEIAQFVSDYVRLWNAYDVPSMRAMWDREEPAPIYVAEEREPLIGWDALEAYWGIDRSKSVRLLSFSGLEVRATGPDMALAFYHMRWSVKIPGNRLYPNPFGGKVRVSAHLRRRAGAWKLYHYIEAPVAMLIQAREYAESLAEPELVARVATGEAE